MTKSLKIIFAGTPEFAIPSLRALVQSEHQVCAVYTQPDRPAGRGRVMTASPVKEFAMQHKLKVRQPESLRDEAEQKILQAFQADLMVVVAYGLLLPSAVLAAPKFGCMNVHASLLPRWRGASPIQQAILSGDKVSGITIMQMEKGLDTGPILTKIQCPISPTDTAGILHDRLSKLGAEALLVALAQLEAGCLKSEAQEERMATMARKITKADAMIDWQEPAAVIERKIRAFNPWPIAQTRVAGEVIRIFEAEVSADQSVGKIPGTILESGPEGIEIETGRGILRITEMQFPGSRVLPVAEIIKSKEAQLAVGVCCE